MTEEEIRQKYPWATLGKTPDRKPNFITSLQLLAEEMEDVNLRLQARYHDNEKNEVLVEEFSCEDAEYLIVAFGTCARVCQKTVELAREKGIKVGLLRPITLFPFPTAILKDYAQKTKAMLTVEMNAGQMVEDVRLSVEHKVPVEHFGRTGGIIHTPEEIVAALEQKIINNGSFRYHKTRESSIL